jgi:hypothetical protein
MREYTIYSSPGTPHPPAPRAGGLNASPFPLEGRPVEGAG